MMIILSMQAREAALRPQAQRRSMARRVPNRGTNERRPNLDGAPLVESTRRSLQRLVERSRFAGVTWERGVG